MIERTKFSFLLQLSNSHAQMITASQNMIVSRVREFNWISGISVFQCWLAYLATMHMKSQFFQAWLPHSSCEINQIVGGNDPLRWLNFKNFESEAYINDVILRIPLYCKLYDDRCIWLRIVGHPACMKLKVPSKVVWHRLFPLYIYI